MHLVILTQYYRPETGAPQNRLSHLARQARAMGHDVTVVTAMPNYPSGTVRSEYRRQLVVDEEIDDVQVFRSWIHSHRGRGTTHQLASYGSFAASALLTAPWRVKPADVLLWESPPLFLAPTADLLARRLGARLVMNVSDLWPESAIELELLSDHRLISLFMGLARRAYRRSDLVFGQTEGILHGVELVAPGTGSALFPNGVDCETFRPRPRDDEMAGSLGVRRGNLVVGYAGNFGRAQALQQVTAAAERLLQDRADVTVLLVGDGPIKQRILDRAGGVDPSRLLVRPSVDSVAMPRLLSIMDVAIVPLADQPIFEGARPSKMFELMASAIPFVFCGRGEGADLATQSGGARVVPPEAPEELATAVSELLALSTLQRGELGLAARRWVEQHFDRNVIARRVVARLEAVADQPKSRRRMSRIRLDA